MVLIRIVLCGIVLHYTVLYGTVRYGLVWHCMVLYRMVVYHIAFYCAVCCDIALYGNSHSPIRTCSMGCNHYHTIPSHAIPCNHIP